MSALDALNRQYQIPHFDEGGSTDAFNFASPNFDAGAYMAAASAPAAAPAASSGFDAGAYLASNPDVAANSYFASNPYEHYTSYGQSEGRSPTGNAAPASGSIGSSDFNAAAFLGPNYTAPTTATAADIQGLYQSTFNRPADQAGLDYWTQQAQSGAPLSAIQQAFYASPEYQGMNSGTTVNVSNPFSSQDQTQTQTSSGVPYSNITSAINSALADTTLTAQQQADKIYTVANQYGVNAQDIATSLGIPYGQVQDYFNQAGKGSYVNAATDTLAPTGSTKAIQDWYQKNLYRDADTPGLNYWSQRFGETLDPAELAVLNQTTEAQNSKTIGNSYQTDLGRVMTPSEYKVWLDAINSGKSVADVQKEIKNAPEAQLYSAYMAETGRKPDPEGYKYFSNRLAQGATIDQIRKEMSGSTEGQKFDVNNLYKEALFRDAKPEELTEITNLLNQGYTMDQLREKAYAMPEVVVAQNFMNYLGRLPDAAGAKYFQDRLAAGESKEKIAHDIALSNESVTANSASVKANLEAVLGKNVVAGMTPEQIADYTRTILDPTRAAPAKPVTKDQFDAQYYLAQNPDVAKDGIDPYSHYKQFGIYEGRAGNAAPPTYLSQADNLKEVYKQIALDPTLGPKLKAENPLLWEKVTPLTSRPDEVVRTERTSYGQFGTVTIDGVKVPVLSGTLMDRVFGGANSGTVSDTSHGRNSWIQQSGWGSNSFSSKIAKGADALGVVTYYDGEGNFNGYTGLNEAADLLKIDKSQFKDYQEPTYTKEATDESGNIVTRGGQPIYQTDENGYPIRDAKGEPIPVTRTITADSQLYDAVSAAAKDLYLVTGDSLTPGRASEGGPQSFDSVYYRREGDELIPISKPQAHGGMQNLDVYTGGSGFNFGRDIAPGIVFVGTAALTMATLGGAAPLTAIGGAVGLSGAAATVAGGVIVGATMGGLNASASGGDIGKGALTGAVIGGITSAMQPLMQTDAMASATKAVADASNGFYTTQQLGSIVGTTLANTVGSAVSGANGDQIFKTFATSLAANGISQSGVSAITSALKDSGITPDTMAKIARATQIAGSTVATSALSGKNQEQIFNNLISQFTDPAKLINTVGSVVTAKDTTGVTGNTTTPTTTTPTTSDNPNGTSTYGEANDVRTEIPAAERAINLANASKDAIATMNAVKSWTGDAKDNLVQATGEMLNQGFTAGQISQNLQDFYKIPVAEADKYAKYMVDQSKQLVGPVQPKATVAATSATTPTQPAVDRNVLVRDREALRDVNRTAPVQLPSTESVTSTAPTSGGMRVLENAIANSTLSGNAQPFVPLAAAAALTGASAVPAAAISSSMAANTTMPRVSTPVDMKDVYTGGVPITEGYGPLPGKTTTPSYGGIPFNPANHVEPPTPFRGEAAPAPEGFSGVPVLPGATPAGDVVTTPANDPAIWNPNVVPGQDTFTPAASGTVVSPTAPKPGEVLEPIAPPVTEPSTAPQTAPEVQPDISPAINPDIAIEKSPAVQEAIQAVARTQAEAQALEQAVPMVVELVTVQAVPRTIAVPRVAVQVNVSIPALDIVVDTVLPPVTPNEPVEPVVSEPVTTPTPNTPTPTPKTPTPKTPAPKQTIPAMRAAKKAAEEETGIFDLGPAFTRAKTNYQLAGQFGMATGGAVATSQYDPFGFPTDYAASNSGVAGSGIFDPKSPFVGSDLKMPKLTVGTTKKNLNYSLSGYPNLGMSNIGYAEGGEVEHNPQFFSEGGLGTLENRFVQGDGDGTSDEVPAMLANGEFVIPADVVSKLGNGSNDAGAGVLDQFLSVIREHAQKHDPRNLPPDSKGPLAYLLEAKKRA
jgi:hypothetical protein